MNIATLTINTLQEWTATWARACFGNRIARDPIERNQRFFEEATELVQSLGATRQECHDMVDYVFSRNVGEPHQEVGGVMICLAALCDVAGLDMNTCALTEAERISDPALMAKIREKQKGKPRFGPARHTPPILSAADGPDYFRENYMMFFKEEILPL